VPIFDVNPSCHCDRKAVFLTAGHRAGLDLRPALAYPTGSNCIQTVMSDRKTVSFVEFAEFSFEINCSSSALFRSFLARNGCAPSLSGRGHEQSIGIAAELIIAIP